MKLAKKYSVFRPRSKPFWLLLYPEGTRLSDKKLSEGQAFSRERGLPVLKHQLYPRTKGFARIMEVWPLTQFIYVYFIDLPRVQVNDPLLGKRSSLPFPTPRHCLEFLKGSLS